MGIHSLEKMFAQSPWLLHSTPRGLLYIQVLIDATSYQLVKTQLSILDGILLIIERHQQQRLKNLTYPNAKTEEVIMNEQLNERCHVIIHSHAAAAAAGNLIPVPGLGIAADITAMTSMCMSLASVMGRNISEEVAKGLAIAALKSTILKQPIRVLTKEISKFVPFVGQLVAPAISVAILESAGWSMVNNLESAALPTH